MDFSSTAATFVDDVCKESVSSNAIGATIVSALIVENIAGSANTYQLRTSVITLLETKCRIENETKSMKRSFSSTLLFLS